MDIDDSDFFVVRKNLNIISVLIMILAYSNAEIHNLNFLGIQVELEGDKLHIGLFTIYIYFIWRYLTKLPLMGIFWGGFISFYLESENGVKKEHNFKTHQNDFFKESLKVKEILESDRNAHLTGITVVRLPGNTLRNLRLSANFYRSTPKNADGSTDMPNVTVNINIKISWIYFMRKLMIFSIKGDKFGDYVFPLVPVVANVLFFILKPEWQGSYNRLFRS
ncbi:MAG: hypothetical protein WAU36_03335 [Cyclobacteriaceae bacterium]